MLIGIVGKPSCGKSTFFKACTLADVDIANYPFTTIKPNHAVGFVKIVDPAKDFNKVSNPRMGFCKNGFRFVPIDLIDVAGLVPDAHKGEGMGAQFLSDLNQADALIHVIDVSGSTNEKGTPVKALSYDPANDIKFLENELDHWYLGILKKGWDKFARQVQQEHRDINKALGKQLSGLGVNEDIVKQSLKELNLDEFKFINWSEEDLFNLSSLLRKKTKPMLIAANKIDVPGAKENFDNLVKQFPNYNIIGCSAVTELALREAEIHKFINYIPGDNSFEILDESKLNENQKKGLETIKKTLEINNSSGIQEVLNEAVFSLLKMIAICPGGVSKLEDSEGRVIPDCFLMKKGTTALEFAYRLHTDFGNKFIRAIDVKTKRTVGKEHVVNHLDILEIVANK
jgi:ribosome-binding ATPase